jgi:isoquinoline 1-oxidoreductase subunit beta
MRGLAQKMGYGSYVAAAAEISVTDGNKIKIHRIVGATDPSHAVNPAQIDRQVAGSFVYGLSALFYGRTRGRRIAALPPCQPTSLPIRPHR